MYHFTYENKMLKQNYSVDVKDDANLKCANT